MTMLIVLVVFVAVFAVVACYCLGKALIEFLWSFDGNGYQSACSRALFSLEFVPSRKKTLKCGCLSFGAALACLGLLFIAHSTTHRILFVHRGLLLVLLWQGSILTGVYNSSTENGERLNSAKWEKNHGLSRLTGTKFVLGAFITMTLALWLIVGKKCPPRTLYPDNIATGARFATLVLITVYHCLAGDDGYYGERKTEETHIVLLAIAVVFSLFWVGEIIFCNPNEWTLFKCSFAMGVWSAIWGACSVSGDKKPSDKCFVVTTSICGVLFVIGLCLGWGAPHPTTHIDHETTDIVYLASAEDAYEIQGSGSVFGFNLTTEGVARYYYLDEATQHKIPDTVLMNKETTEIDDSYTGRPYLETYIKYDLWYGTYNRQPQAHKENVEVHYIFHVPPGSIPEVFAFDLS